MESDAEDRGGEVAICVKSEHYLDAVLILLRHLRRESGHTIRFPEWDIIILEKRDEELLKGKVDFIEMGNVPEERCNGQGLSPDSD